MTNPDFNLSLFLQEIQPQFSPLFLPDLHKDNTLMMDFSRNNGAMAHLDFTDTASLNQYVFSQLEETGMTYGYGGYQEDRAVYARSSVFATAEGSRNIHLGVDVWTKAETPVFAPLDAVVHSFGNNNNQGDYGPTIILEHQIGGNIFYSLYGHLTEGSLEGLYPGMKIRKGIDFCLIGNYPDNGDWPPHLHFQIISDMLGKKGDFPGVSTTAEKEKFMKLCPDPMVFFPSLQ